MRITLTLGDCLDVLSEVPVGCVVVTDPPYGVGLGIGKDARGASGSKRRHGLAKPAYNGMGDTYEDFVGSIVPRLNACLDRAKRAAVFTGPHIQEQRKADAIGGVYCPVGAGRHRWGFKTFLPVLFYGTAPDLNRGAKPNTIKSNGYVEKGGHPCPKPLDWMLWLVGLTTRPGDIVFDPFMGRGTTAEACLVLGRDFIGVEIDPAYFAVARRRIEAARSATPLFSAVE